MQNYCDQPIKQFFVSLDSFHDDQCQQNVKGHRTKTLCSGKQHCHTYAAIFIQNIRQDSNHTDPHRFDPAVPKSKCHCIHPAGFSFPQDTKSHNSSCLLKHTCRECRNRHIYIIMTVWQYHKPLPVCLQITKKWDPQNHLRHHKRQNSCKKRKKISLSFHRKINSSQNRYPDTDQ